MDIENQFYPKVLSYMNKGDYETAYSLFEDKRNGLTLKEEKLKKECERLITEQYYILIKEQIRRKHYSKANRLQQEYIKKHDFDDKIKAIEIPDPSPLITLTSVLLVLIIITFLFIILS